MTRAYAWKKCDVCGREIGASGGNFHRHMSTHQAKVDDRLQRLLGLLLLRPGYSMSRQHLPSDMAEDFAKGRIRFTYADAVKLEKAGFVKVERTGFGGREFIATLTPSGLRVGALADAAVPNTMDGTT